MSILAPLHKFVTITNNANSRRNLFTVIKCVLSFFIRDPATAKQESMFTHLRQHSFDDARLFLFILPGFPDPGWKVFYDSATPNSERMPDPWDAVSGLDR